MKFMKGFSYDSIVQEAQKQLDIPFENLPISYDEWMKTDFLFKY